MIDNKKKISIISFSGDFDKLVAAFTLATGSAAMNYEVNLFFTFWGLYVIKKKKGHDFTGKGMLARTFNFLMGGVNNVPLSRLNFCGISPKLMTALMKKRNVATLNELYKAAHDLGINFYACEMSMHILGLKLDDFDNNIKEVIGVPGFLKYSEGGDRIFI
ncbi:MAG: DsrE/DsrF/DrsH-like family protein [Bacteroidales bacterium]|nr:DsrE/DsrF/DrsH-like family protein [Bacteroidales bacterium]